MTVTSTIELVCANYIVDEINITRYLLYCFQMKSFSSVLFAAALLVAAQVSVN